jgi:hypothetical protein
MSSQTDTIKAFDYWKSKLVEFQKLEIELTTVDEFLGGPGVYLTLEGDSNLQAYGSMSGVPVSWSSRSSKHDLLLHDFAYVSPFIEAAIDAETANVHLANQAAHQFQLYKKKIYPETTDRLVNYVEKSAIDIVKKWVHCLYTEAVFIAKKLTIGISPMLGEGDDFHVEKVFMEYFETAASWDTYAKRHSSEFTYKESNKKRKRLDTTQALWPHKDYRNVSSTPILSLSMSRVDSPMPENEPYSFFETSKGILLFPRGFDPNQFSEP